MNSQATSLNGSLSKHRLGCCCVSLLLWFVQLFDHLFYCVTKSSVKYRVYMVWITTFQYLGRTSQVRICEQLHCFLKHREIIMIQCKDITSKKAFKQMISSKGTEDLDWTFLEARLLCVDPTNSQPKTLTINCLLENFYRGIHEWISYLEQ